VGPDSETLIDVILRSRPHPEQGFRSAIGILGLVKRYGQERVSPMRRALQSRRSERSAPIKSAIFELRRFRLGAQVSIGKQAIVVRKLNLLVLGKNADAPPASKKGFPFREDREATYPCCCVKVDSVRCN
jgi:hypothetical protein